MSDRQRFSVSSMLLSAAILLYGLVLASAVRGEIIRVPGDQPTIQAGLASSVPGDTVLVAPGAYSEHDLSMKSGVCLRSESGEMDGAIINAHGLGRVMRCDNVGASSTIQGFTMTGGNPGNAYGGAIHCQNSSPVISHCLLTGNSAGPGGGAIYCNNSSPALQSCVIALNGQTIDGGGLNCTHSSPMLTDCLIYGNSAQIWGGAMFCQGSAPTFVRCTITGNRAYQGGGIWCCYESQVVLEDCIVSSATQGEGVYGYLDTGHPSEVVLGCSDVFGNAAGNYGGTVPDQTGVHGNISASPLFCDPAAADHHLAAGSPCLPENNDCGRRMGALDQGCELSAGVRDGEPRTGPGTSNPLLEWIAPNPFRPGDEFELRMAEPGELSLSVVDVTGRPVRHLLRATPCAAGMQRVSWDGTDETGRNLPRGVYYYRLDAGRRVGGGSIILLR